MRHNYWDQSTQPLYCLVFVAPLLLAYEVGVLWLGPRAMRNGADVWLRDALDAIGLGHYLLLPAATCGVLLSWHHVSRRRWTLRPDVLSGMACESIALALCLIVMARVYAVALGTSLSTGNSAAAIVEDAFSWPMLISFIGAGVYEELLFRVLCLQAFIHGCRRVGADQAGAAVVSICATSLLFAAAHYRLFVSAGGDFSWYSFFFRVGAGGFFCLLFLRRGFGVATGTHVAYDLLVAAN